MTTQRTTQSPENQALRIEKFKLYCSQNGEGTITAEENDRGFWGLLNREPKKGVFTEVVRLRSGNGGFLYRVRLSPQAFADKASAISVKKHKKESVKTALNTYARNLDLTFIESCDEFLEIQKNRHLIHVIEELKAEYLAEQEATLIDSLKNLTQDLKERYIERSQEYAAEEFDIMRERNGWSLKQWADFFGWEYGPQGRGFRKYEGFEPGFYNSSKARKLDRAESEARQITNRGKGEHIYRATKAALAHYENSILKLADRITRKGLEKDLVISKESIEQNIHLTISDGNKTVRAWTVVAFGPIQKPHYRYLIK